MQIRVYTRTMSTDPAPRCYCVSLRRASRKLTALYDEALAPAGVNVAQFSLLRKINRLGPLSLTALAEVADLDRSTVGRNVRVLAETGMMTLEAGEDQREAVVSLTAVGRRAVATGSPLWDNVQADIETRLGKRAAQLFDLLEAL